MAGIAVIGDLMLGRHVDALIRRHGLSELLRSVREAAAGRPLVANLESPLCDGPQARPGEAPRFHAPTARAAELYAAGVRAVSLANNHLFDAGHPGLEQTLAAVEAAGLSSTGAGRDRRQAMQPAILEIDGARFGVLGFSYASPAGDDRAGVAYLYDDTVADAIRAARAQVDVLVVMPHSGIELFRYPLPRDQEAYRRMIELGADVVVGNHPHCVQAAEWWQGRPIFYAIGDCLFDHHEDDVWERFWANRAHARRFGLDTSRDVPGYSLMVTIDHVPGGAPAVATIAFAARPAPAILDDEEQTRFDRSFSELCSRLQSSDEVRRQRHEIQEALLTDLRARGIG